MSHNSSNQPKRSRSPEKFSWPAAHQRATQPETNQQAWQAAYAQARQETESPEAKVYLPDEVAEKILHVQNLSAETVSNTTGRKLVLTGGLMVAVTIAGFIRSYRQVAAAAISLPKT